MVELANTWNLAMEANFAHDKACHLLTCFLGNRWRDERGPLDRRPPHDDFFRDRPPYPEDPYLRDPASYPPHPEDIGHSSEPIRVEKKPETIPVDSILDSPGRDSRPDRVSFGNV